MLATFLIEIALAAYVLWRYHMTPLTRLATLLLIMLAVFQLAEYMVCGGLGLSGMDWSRVGFMAITALPPLGLHFGHALAGKQNKWLIGAAYITAAGFAGYFALATIAFTGNQCQGNYVIFELTPQATWLYSIFYYGWVILGLGCSLYFAKQANHVKQRRALRAFAFGYVSFLVPTSIINLISPETLAGIPSIMCGFAIIFALVLSLRVVPLQAEQNTT